MWEKKGWLYSCDFYNTGYAQDAFIDILNNDVWRIYYSARTKEVKSYPYYLDVEAKNLKNIINKPTEPIMTLGNPGCFDDSGITMTSIVQIDEHTKYLYYCGWNRKVSVSYSLSIGVCKVVDNKIFNKLFYGPIMDRSIHNPIAVSAPMVIRDDNIFRMWYISFLDWKMYENKLEPVYVVKHAFSKDGVNWDCDDNICIESSYDGEAIGRPYVIKDDGIYKMWFSTRGVEDYRTKDGNHYMIGYAESRDGIKFERKPEKCNIGLSESGWDSEMLEYASVIRCEDTYYMLYNGNDFGKTGFGYAIEKQ